MPKTDTKTVADFTDSDQLLFNKAQKKWYRFVQNEDGSVGVFLGEGGEAKQEWKYSVTMGKAYIRSFWDCAVASGYVRMVLTP